MIILSGVGIYFEDPPFGRKFRTIGRTLFEGDLVHFVTCTGMSEVILPTGSSPEPRARSRAV